MLELSDGKMRKISADNSIEVANTVYLKKDPYYLDIVENIAGIYTKLGLYEEAEKLLLFSYKTRAELGETSQLNFMRTTAELAKIYHYTGDYTKSELLYEDLGNSVASIYGKESVNYVGISNDLANLYSDLGRYEEAEKVFRNGIRLLEKSEENEKTDRLITLYSNLATNYILQEKPEEAENTCYIA